MRNAKWPRSSLGAAPAGPYVRAGEKGLPQPGCWRRPGLKRTAILLWLVFVGLSLPQQQREVRADERNVEQYAIKRAQPTYPPLAQKQRIEGIVVIQVSVGSSGKVTNAEFIRGNNIFKSVSLEAARRWEFKVPTGEGIEGTIRFTFKLE
jgi:TonB family protein